MWKEAIGGRGSLTKESPTRRGARGTRLLLQFTVKREREKLWQELLNTQAHAKPGLGGSRNSQPRQKPQLQDFGKRPNQRHCRRTGLKGKVGARPVNTSGGGEVALLSSTQSHKRPRTQAEDEPHRPRKPRGTDPPPSQQEPR